MVLPPKCCVRGWGQRECTRLQKLSTVVDNANNVIPAHEFTKESRYPATSRLKTASEYIPMTTLAFKGSWVLHVSPSVSMDNVLIRFDET